MQFTKEESEKLLAGAISYLMEGDDMYEAGLLLFCELDIEENMYSGINLVLRGNRILYETMQKNEDRSTIAIKHALEAVLPINHYSDIIARVMFSSFDADWRTKLAEMMEGKVPLNQCIPIKSIQRYQWEGMYFRSACEIAIARILSEFKVLFLPNCMARFGSQNQPDRMNKEADFLVCFQGKWGIIEVDGETYHSVAAKDHERDRLFRSHGIKVIERFTAKRCLDNPRSVVLEFLELLKKNG